jgi:xanthosine utilization system XapX-like protein
MNPGAIRTWYQFAALVFGILGLFAGYQAHRYGKKVDAIENAKQQANQQKEFSKLAGQIESIGNENRTKLLEKYPAGYVF